MDVPGLELLELLGCAAWGETWRARDAATGGAATVVRINGAAVSEAAADSLVRFRHEHAMPVLAAVRAGGLLALRLPPLPRLSLRTLLAGRPTLRAGEAVTLGLPLAQALAAGHGWGLVHGGLDPGDVLLESDGRPVLLGLGFAAIAGQAAAPADDVHALALLLTRCLGDAEGPGGDAVRAALAPALVGHPAGRPGAQALAAALGASCSPVPLLLPQHGGAATTGGVAAAEATSGGATDHGAGTRGAGTGRVGTGRVGTGRVGTGRVGTGRVGTGRVGTGRVGTGKAASGAARPAAGARSQGPVADSFARVRRALRPRGRRPPWEGPTWWPPRPRTLAGAGTALAVGAIVVALPALRPAPAPAAGSPPRQVESAAGLPVSVADGSAPQSPAPQSPVAASPAAASPAPESPAAASPAPESPAAASPAPESPAAAGASSPPAPDAGTVPGGSGPSRSGASTPAWATVLRRLGNARSSALAAGDPRLLAAADAPDSSAAAVDSRRLAAWRAAGAVVRGGRSRLLGVRVVSAGRDAVVLDTRERVEAWSAVDAAGRVLQRSGRDGERAFRVTLVRTRQGWRTASVVAR